MQPLSSLLSLQLRVEALLHALHHVHMGTMLVYDPKKN
jgi:hypothetical protein